MHVRFFLWRLLIVMIFPALAGAAETQERTLEHGGIKRVYRLRVPDSYDGTKPVPLVLGFHGGQGNALQAERGLMFNPLADRDGFIVAYPQGAPVAAGGFHWNDGRKSPRFPDADKVNDVGFIRALIGTLQKEFEIDPARIYATGNSNGGFMTQRLGWELSDVLAGIGPSAGTLGVQFVSEFAPKQSIHVVELHGTADTFVPYEGGEVIGRGGLCISAPKMVELWVKANEATIPPLVEDLPDTHPEDGVTVQRETYDAGPKGAAVIFYKLRGHGHMWPGRPVGGPRANKPTQELNAAEVVWEFFRTHPKPGSGAAPWPKSASAGASEKP